LGEKTFTQLTDEQLFNQINSESNSNSIATIIKHLRGNMLSCWTDFLTTDGEKEWRKRDDEFENDIITRKELLVKWEEGYYNGTKYAEFTSYQSGQATNIAWLVSPEINMDVYQNETLAFDVAQAYVSSSSNSIELLVSTNYNGTDVLAATWQPLNFTKPPLDFDTNFDFFSSGLVDLSSSEIWPDEFIRIEFTK
jgi:hypothetical protein